MDGSPVNQYRADGMIDFACVWGGGVCVHACVRACVCVCLCGCGGGGERERTPTRKLYFTRIVV